ncbi:hypothetical protein Tco_0632768, partial [Tanacetum coccineum]
MEASSLHSGLPENRGMISLHSISLIPCSDEVRYVVVVVVVDGCGLVEDLLMQYSSGKSALVFCSTRKGAQVLAQTAMNHDYSNLFIKSSEPQERLREASLSCGDKQIQSYILYG